MAAPDVSALAGLRLLVVEDDYMIAEDISMQLEDFGCDVAGPVGTIEEALGMLKRGGLDGALLDANLNGESSAPIAVALNDASIPFVVATGYGSRELSDGALDAAPRIIKPFGKLQLGTAMVAAFTGKIHLGPGLKAEI